MRHRSRLAGLVHVVLIAFGVVIAYPLVWMVFLSLKNQKEMYTAVWAPPRHFQWANYPEAWSIGNIGVTFINTLILTIVSVFFILLLCYFAAYAQARIKFVGKNVIMTLLVATMFVPAQVVIIPLYSLESFLHILDTRYGLIFPYIAGGIPFSVFLLTAFLRTIPFELEESAFLDGCRRTSIIRWILLPLSRPGFATVIIFQSFGIWNQFFLPLILTQSPRLMTVTLGLLSFSQQWGSTDYPRLFAALTIISAPVIILYAVFQKQFISGITAGALKM